MGETIHDAIEKLDEHTKSDARQFEAIENRLDAIHDTVKEIKMILVGDPNYKRKGLVVMVDEHESIVTKGKWTLVLIGLLITAASFMISQLPQFFVNHAK